MSEEFAQMMAVAAAVAALVFQVKTKRAEMIEKWMCSLRDAVSSFLGSCESLRAQISGLIATNDAIYSEIILASARIKFLLNPMKSDQKALMDLCEKLISLAQQRNNFNNQYEPIEKEIIEKTQSILNSHWQRVNKKEFSQAAYISLILFVGIAIIVALMPKEDEKKKDEVKFFPMCSALPPINIENNCCNAANKSHQNKTFNNVAVKNFKPCK